MLRADGIVIDDVLLGHGQERHELGRILGKTIAALAFVAWRRRRRRCGRLSARQDGQRGHRALMRRAGASCGIFAERDANVNQSTRDLGLLACCDNSNTDRVA